jgi:hypothetical protein
MICSSRLALNPSCKYEHPPFEHNITIMADLQGVECIKGMLRRIGFRIEYCLCAHYRDFSQSITTTPDLNLTNCELMTFVFLYAIFAASLSPLSVYPRRVPCLYHPQRDAPLLSLMIQFQFNVFHMNCSARRKRSLTLDLVIIECFEGRIGFLRMPSRDCAVFAM